MNTSFSDVQQTCESGSYDNNFSEQAMLTDIE